MRERVCALKLPNSCEPALFIRGSRSNYIKDEDWEHTKRLFPNAELLTIEDAGHWVHADKPKELLEVINGFLKG